MLYLEPLLIKLRAQQSEISKLKEQLSINSQNSSKPPSSDLKKPSKKKKIANKRSNRKQGAQIGHKGVNRLFESTQNVDNIIDCSPPQYCICGGFIIIKKSKFSKKQVYDITASNTLFLNEYRIYSGYCKSCSKNYKGKMPEHLDNSMLGPGIKSLMSIFVSDYKLSKRNVKDILKQLYNLNISVGTVSNSEKRVSDALKLPYDDLSAAVKTQKDINADETRHYENNKLNWAWVACNNNLTVLMLDKSRGKKAAKKLLGENFSGILTTDRYSAYNIVDPKQRQLCWAHLTRDFVKISQRDGDSGNIGDILLFHQNKIFYYWGKHKSGVISHAKLSKAINVIKKSLKSSLTNALSCSHKTTVGTCKNILKYIGSLFTFAKYEGIEPTNNHAERQIRKYVIYRKLCFGTQSKRGSRFIERIFSISATCRQQSINTLSYIKEAIIKFNSGQPPPKLLYA